MKLANLLLSIIAVCSLAMTFFAGTAWYYFYAYLGADIGVIVKRMTSIP